MTVSHRRSSNREPQWSMLGLLAIALPIYGAVLAGIAYALAGLLSFSIPGLVIAAFGFPMTFPAALMFATPVMYVLWGVIHVFSDRAAGYFKVFFAIAAAYLGLVYGGALGDFFEGRANVAPILMTMGSAAIGWHLGGILAKAYQDPP